jgi:hypothetical protein
MAVSGSFDRGTTSPEPPKPESASMLTHASLIQRTERSARAVLLLPQPLKTEHTKAPKQKTPVAMQMQYSNYKKRSLEIINCLLRVKN